jgi:hypothetical protein
MARNAFRAAVALDDIFGRQSEEYGQPSPDDQLQ